VPLTKQRINMKIKTRKRIYIFIFILLLICSGYYIFINKAFDITQKLIYDSVIQQAEVQTEDITSTSESDGQTSHENMPESEATQQGNQTSNENKDGVYIDDEPKGDKAYDKSKDISFEDKRRIIQLVSKKLSSEDIKYLRGLSKGGLTPHKKKLAVELALKRFTSQEIKEIQALYAKYKKYTN
jgi:preprotein translocase subunit SecF